MKERLYRYYPDDFGKLEARVLHMDLEFDVFDDHTVVSSKMFLKSIDPIYKLCLNARDLEILLVESDQPMKYNYRQKDAMLDISFETPVPRHTEFTISTKTICRPTKNILEGLYYDETPAGAPPQQITQCQQWGFQRIVPCLDDMTAKCTYRTTIRADSRYTNMITNGDITVPRKTVYLGADGSRDEIVYENMSTPMAPYLFFLGVGTYATYKMEFEYPDESCFELELLVPPGSDKNAATQSLDILHDAVMWIYLFTGPESQKHLDKKRQIFELTKLRDQLKHNLNSANVLLENVNKTMNNLNAIREKIDLLSDGLTFGYKYTGTVYREIGMQNSDFGGMENVGNTTITTNRIMPSKNMTDASFEYMADVKAHEYYHNINGSEVTGNSPFEIWLNEAVTVHIENAFHAYFFGDDYTRLQTIIDLYAPVSGTFALDSGAASMPILPDGFNDPNDLITSVTYVKAPEFVRMVETWIGKETFAHALHAYHRKFSHKNARTYDWIHEMEFASKKDLSKMANVWLHQTGYPILFVTKIYDAKKSEFRLKLKQALPLSKRPWIFPFSFALADRKGKIIYEDIILIQNEEEEVVLTVEEPAFVSLNRGGSFYGKIVTQADQKELMMQARKDKDIVSRFLAFNTLTDREKERLLKNPDSTPSCEYADLYHELLCDHTLLNKTGGLFLTIFESTDNEEFAHRYDRLFEVRRQIQNEIAKRHEISLKIIYEEYFDPADPEDEKLYSVRGSLRLKGEQIKRRQVKNNALRLLSTLDTPEIHGHIKRQFLTATNATDRLVAFSAWLNSSAPEKKELTFIYMEECKKDLVAWESFLATVAGTDSPDCLDMVQLIEKDPAFRIEQANDQRALYGTFARNRKYSLQTPEGLEFLKSTIIRMASINEYSTVGLLNAFSAIDKMEIQYHVPLVTALDEIAESIDPEKSPSVYNRIKKLLVGAPNAVRAYEIEHNKSRAFH
ncbi:M1 family metallopeptidase [Methanolapillus ohkumae]|uniref:Aminopeptidase N n=1 Tax=Methanolapillus ohkumae TaxID=3028298 RepID=A0AA96V553_9EURY|nr:Aminopeptidase N [Methanosarcinaceae archaeon Am2]